MLKTICCNIMSVVVCIVLLVLSFSHRINLDVLFISAVIFYVTRTMIYQRGQLKNN